MQMRSDTMLCRSFVFSITLAASIFISGSISSRAPSNGNVTQTEVYTAGEGGYYCFRIPALLRTNKGTLLAFAEGRGQHTGSCADHGDVHIVVKRSFDLGQTWSNLTVVYKENGHTIGKKQIDISLAVDKKPQSWLARQA